MAQTELMKLKPAPGRWVPLENGDDWPENGAVVPLTLYIRRRLRDGDLVPVNEKQDVPEKASAAAKGDK